LVAAAGDEARFLIASVGSAAMPSPTVSTVDSASIGERPVTCVCLQKRSQLETELAGALAGTGEHARFRFEARPWGTGRPGLGSLERKLGELCASESDGGSLVGDLGLQFRALTAAAESAETAELVLGGG